MPTLKEYNQAIKHGWLHVCSPRALKCHECGFPIEPWEMYLMRVELKKNNGYPPAPLVINKHREGRCFV